MLHLANLAKTSVLTSFKTSLQLFFSFHYFKNLGLCVAGKLTGAAFDPFDRSPFTLSSSLRHYQHHHNYPNYYLWTFLSLFAPCLQPIISNQANREEWTYLASSPSLCLIIVDHSTTSEHQPSGIGINSSHYTAALSLTFPLISSFSISRSLSFPKRLLFSLCQLTLQTYIAVWSSLGSSQSAVKVNQSCWSLNLYLCPHPHHSRHHHGTTLK